jgi:hypothetical protein
VLAIAGLLWPARMLLVIIFDLAWKLLWTAVVAVPLWARDEITPGVAETLFACAWAIPFLAVIPWRYVYGLLSSTMEPWRGTRPQRAAS